jgi:hypothetical protein
MIAFLLSFIISIPLLLHLLVLVLLLCNTTLHYVHDDSL